MIIHKNQIKEYTSSFDDGEDKTVFEIGLIDHVTLARIIDFNVELKADNESELDDRKTVFHNKEGNILFAKCGLKGWRGFKDSNGNDIPIEFDDKPVLGVKTKSVKDDCLTKLPFAVVQEIGQAVRELNIVGEIERKNF